MVALSDSAADKEAVDQPCYSVNDTQTLVGHKSVGMLLKRFLDKLTATELEHVLEETLEKSANRLVTNESLGIILTVAGFVDNSGIAMRGSM